MRNPTIPNPGGDLVTITIPLTADRHPTWEQQLLHHLNEGGGFTSGDRVVQIQADDLVFQCSASELAEKRHQVQAEIKRVDAWWAREPSSR